VPPDCEIQGRQSAKRPTALPAAEYFPSGYSFHADKFKFKDQKVSIARRHSRGISVSEVEDV
jgi:hypothetical protein